MFRREAKPQLPAPRTAARSSATCALYRLRPVARDRRAPAALCAFSPGMESALSGLRDFLHAQSYEHASVFNSRLTADQFFEMIATPSVSSTEAGLDMSNRPVAELRAFASPRSEGRRLPFAGGEVEALDAAGGAADNRAEQSEEDGRGAAGRRAGRGAPRS